MAQTTSHLKLPLFPIPVNFMLVLGKVLTDCVQYTAANFAKLCSSTCWNMMYGNLCTTPGINAMGMADGSDDNDYTYVEVTYGTYIYFVVLARAHSNSHFAQSSD